MNPEVRKQLYGFAFPSSFLLFPRSFLIPGAPLLVFCLETWGFSDHSLYALTWVGLTFWPNKREDRKRKKQQVFVLPCFYFSFTEKGRILSSLGILAVTVNSATELLGHGKKRKINFPQPEQLSFLSYSWARSRVLLEFSLPMPSCLLLDFGLPWIQVTGYWRGRMVNSSLVLCFFQFWYSFLMCLLLFAFLSLKTVTSYILFGFYSCIQCEGKVKCAYSLVPGTKTMSWICYFIYC